MNQSANNGPCAGSLHRALPDRTASYSAQEDPGAHAASCSGSCSAACAERCTCSHLQTKLQKQSHCIQSHCALRLPAVQRIPQPRHVTRFDGLQLLHRAVPEPRLRQQIAADGRVAFISVSFLRPTRFRPEPGSNPISTTVTMLNRILFGLLKFYFTLNTGRKKTSYTFF